jgi:asparagine synthase (glutamine-hydrolysing)
MCGVLVIYSKKKSLNKKKCLMASKEIYNRGPDHFKSSFYKDNKLFISNTVLSITTSNSRLSKKPTQSLNKNFVISFNGEIYNYELLKKKYLNYSKFQKKMNDTEVLINLYQRLEYQLVPKVLNGMFAYVVYDKLKDKLIIVNDTQGEKNLYFYQDEEYFIVSSTIKSIQKFLSRLNLNSNVLANYFQTRHFMSLDETCFKNINLLSSSSNNTFNLKSDKFFKKKFDFPYNLISKKLYSKFSKMKESELISYFEKSLINQAKLMIPDKKFGCIISGGIDSTLQAAIINKIKTSKINLCIDHKNKDPIMKFIERFNIYFKNKIIKIKLGKQDYKKLIKKCYKIVSSPLQTHDLPSRLKLSEYFKKKGCKVFFSADGCDELLGGQQIYKEIFSKKFNIKNNISPYSSILKSQVEILDKTSNKKLLFKFNKFWRKTLNSYSFIKDRKERNIQSSLFLDYFMQATNVGNRSNDLVCCDNSVEPRNIFIQKNILKIIVNLPLKYKINFNSIDEKFAQKYILKKLFAKYFDKKLIFSKSGFSGFPNSIKLNKKNAKKRISKFLKLKFKNGSRNFDKKNISRDLNWKIINTNNFLNEFK